MITIGDKSFKSNIPLESILAVKTKVDMLKIIQKLDLYVSPNLKKEETARRVARELLGEPIAIISTLCKAELELLDELIKAGGQCLRCTQGPKDRVQTSEVLFGSHLRRRGEE